MQIDVSFALWKALTALLRDEHDSYDAVIERLLESSPDDLPKTEVGAERTEPEDTSSAGAYFKEVFLPNGTELRATYKGKTHFAEIRDSEWIDRESGRTRTSPSQAAYSITGKNVNGWLFWIVKRPNDEGWRSLNALRIRP